MSDRATKYRVHDEAVLLLKRKLERVGVSFVPKVSDEELLPPWAFTPASRKRIDATNRLFPRDLAARLAPASEPFSIKVFGSASGELNSSVYRSIGYQALSAEMYLNVLVGYDDRQVKRTMHWRKMFQARDFEPANPGGIYTDKEFLTAIAAVRLPQPKDNENET